MTAAEFDAELDAMLALIDREDALARQAKERACDGATFAEAWAWLQAQEGDLAACTA